ncbi:MAG: ABC transporter permease [Gemmatimonadaceae bacterium]
MNLRYAFRRLLRSPGFTIAVVLTLGVGIWANATIFSVVNAVLLRPPAAVTEPNRLVALYTSDFSGPAYGTSSYPDYEEFRQQNDVFQGVAAFSMGSAGIGDGEDLERIGVETVSHNLFQVLGVRPQLGRAFLPEEGSSGGTHALAVISHELWQRRFGGDRAIVGTSVRMNDQPFTIVGVAPEGFTGALRGVASDAWVPFRAPRLGLVESDLNNRGNRGLLITGRLGPGTTMARAQAQMDVVARQLAAAYPEQWTDRFKQSRRITLVSEFAARVPPQMRGPVLGFMGLLMAVVGVVLLICCANVAGLLLARAAGRSREIGIRLSVGASRAHIIRQMLTESVVLAALGGIVGVLLTLWTTDLLMAFQPPLPVRLALNLDLDVRVVAFIVAVTIGTGILFGLAPALRASRLDLVSVLKSESASLEWGVGRERRFSLRNALVVGQISLSLLLLVGALLFLRTLRSAVAMDPGFRVENLLLASVEPRPGLEISSEQRARIAFDMQQRIAAIPGVSAATWADAAPLGFYFSRRGMMVVGYTPQPGEEMEFHSNVVGPRYFETMEIPIIKGRGFTVVDRSGAPEVVVVNEAFAQHFWPAADPVGQRISMRGEAGPFHEVIGVARLSKYVSLGEPPRLYVYLPALQDSWGTMLHVRAACSPTARACDPWRLLPAIRREVQAAAPDWTIGTTRTMEEQLAGSLIPQRIAAAALGVFGALALLLASVGLYGVVAYAVAQRTREIGVRVALGAKPWDVLGLVLRQSASLVGAGLAIGLAASWALTRLLSNLLLGVSATDTVTFLGASLLLAIVAFVATYLPARRAASVDPMAALRYE